MSSSNELNFENLDKNLLHKCKDVEINESEPPKKKSRSQLNSEILKDCKQLEDPPLTESDKLLTANRLTYDFYNTPCEQLAQQLLGKILVRRLENGIILKGRIVETESYLGGIDKASQTYQNKVTPRNIPMYMPPGTIYVYFTYGMYHCFNISSQGEGAAVLLRALEPVEGIEEMLYNRKLKSKKKNSEKTRKILKAHELCNGPSKICMAFEIDKDCCKYSLCTWKNMWIEPDYNPPDETIKIIKCPRIGIDSAGPEWASKPLRYYIYNNNSVSKRDKKAEQDFVKDN
ncbi:DNA-3-methyladenine glycosylase-like [Microplitis mediator]|uniref:DNA-3-methyladenine glycosylase-like n=1 Tax=Microplitis mediator TaxID=375433 RepID=UPI002552459F|nr:DNA-3-methyladenine glycosylase-like [Microplitis mediator]